MENPGLDVSEEQGTDASRHEPNGTSNHDKSVKNRYASDSASRNLANNAGTPRRSENDAPLPLAQSNVESAKPDLYYSVNEHPPLHLTFVLGFQHYLTCAGSTLSIPFILCGKMCMLDDDPGQASIICTIMMVSGIVTLLQSTLGTRLPIIQGGSFSFITPALAILALEEWRCPSKEVLYRMTPEQRTEVWQQRMRELQGAIIISSLTEVALGFFGVIGIILKYITPLTVAPAIALIGLGLFKVSAQHAASNWWIAAMTITLIIIMSQYIKTWKVPIPFVKSKATGKTVRYPLFEVFPFLIAIAISWIVCAILTATNVLSETNAARTDIKLNIIQQTPWFIFSYPFQWGIPTFSVGSILGMVSGVLASVVESIGDYYACARISGATPPPKHALNRGIFIEGVGCVIAGIFGTGNGTTSYSENIGAISITKVGSRRVVQCAGILLIVFSILGKVGAVFVSIPEPIIGGIFCIVFATVFAVGLTNLQGVDLNSSRNIFIIGFSMFFGLVISQWMDENKSSVNVGSDSVNQIIVILLSTGMFVAGFLGFVLDNTIPGTPEERGLHLWTAHLKLNEDGDGTKKADKSYDLPGMNYVERISFLRYFPISPTFRGFKTKLPKLPTKISKNKISISGSEVIHNNITPDRLNVYNVS